MLIETSEEVDIYKRVDELRLKAVQAYNINPEKCHVGHLMLQGMYNNPEGINQIDAATDKTETNLSVAIRSSRLANAMSKCGLQTGDTVVLMGPNHLDLGIAFYACHYNGYSMCGIDTSVDSGDLAILCTYIKPRMVICQKSCEEKVKNALVENNLNGHIVVFDDPNNDIECFTQEHNGTERDFRPAEFNHSEINAWLMLTSGTTGIPKVATIPFDRLLNGICCWWAPFPAPFQTVMAMATLQWMSSLFYFASGPIRGYTRVQSSVPLKPELLIALINKYRPNVTAWTSFLLSQFITGAKNVWDLSCFKYIAIGGSAIDKPLLDKFRKQCNAFLYLVYGMTELLVPVFDFDSETPFGSTGTPKKKYQFKIIDEEGYVLDKPYQSGELWIKGDAFFTGYMNNPEETRETLTEDGWFKTGDIFYRDDRDYYYFVERKRLIIKHFGFMISPLQIEETIKRHPGIQEACVVSIPDYACGELPIAAIMKEDGHQVDSQEIFELLKDSLPEIKQLTGGLFFVDSMPETPSGKIHRAKIKDMALTTPKIFPI
ncbi:hypothetical protein K1T71_004552 [Dendrolimus kikuchii]|uniref:Uncharacterized protein n=1 Tax=Dendrolimus kikuchii TaxID=765133 RepID=A0ACC1D805_9NEOP|nr:hypothetical protein K1T71_004552 [Dendrolimus kikuchii]